ncbi:MAG: hypothetical protein HC859_12440 [Bacteroidia bacterium]|nr:hypothetical protein [Bacteroidia bacterium]
MVSREKAGNVITLCRPPPEWPAHGAVTVTDLVVHYASHLPAVLKGISFHVAAREKIGICGQAPSDYPHFARFLVECGIDSVSFNPDALITGIQNIAEAEAALQTKLETVN